MVVAPRLPELQQRSDRAPRDRGGLLEYPVLDIIQELDWMILVDPFQLNIFHDSMIKQGACGERLLGKKLKNL
ncbi:hypothetical protein DUI87_15495 [Hirundo rustica rustica]|uniref:Uncharacterized protein n=1 Tax=Hirundo rustica rustica TaxID=333673 RepID=A0A3M0K490_HIRRU|nr:hypothetical protein DUI87_15495 [Hirundo rustica rustica]